MAGSAIFGILGAIISVALFIALIVTVFAFLHFITNPITYKTLLLRGLDNNEIKSHLIRISKFCIDSNINSYSALVSSIMSNKSHIVSKNDINIVVEYSEYFKNFLESLHNDSQN